MTYLFYTTILLLPLLAATALYLTRARWTPLLPDFLNPGHLYSALPGGPFSSSSFANDIEAGLSSADFDLSGNVAGGDARAGLDDGAKREILAIMKKRRLRFDEARRVYMEGRFKANGIGPDGRPRDPKFVSFS
ncbi:unnamed protein product [Discula destructiva]